MGSQDKGRIHHLIENVAKILRHRTHATPWGEARPTWKGIMLRVTYFIWTYITKWFIVRYVPFITSAITATSKRRLTRHNVWARSTITQTDVCFYFLCFTLYHSSIISFEMTKFACRKSFIARRMSNIRA